MNYPFESEFYLLESESVNIPNDFQIKIQNSSFQIQVEKIQVEKIQIQVKMCTSGFFEEEQSSADL